MKVFFAFRISLYRQKIDMESYMHGIQELLEMKATRVQTRAKSVGLIAIKFSVLSYQPLKPFDFYLQKLQTLADLVTFA